MTSQALSEEKTTPISENKDRFDEPIYPPKKFRIRVDPEIPTNSTISIYGKRKTGKSFWIRWYMFNNKELYPWGWVFTNTENNEFFPSFVPKSKILGRYSDYNLNKIIERQNMMESTYLKYGNVNPLAFVIWDDALDERVKYSDTLHKYYFNSRHFFTLNIMSAQHVTGTPAPVRQNTDYAVCFRNTNLKALERLTDDFAHNKDKWEFKRVLDEYTYDQSFLLINNDPNAEPQERMYYGKAEETPIFTLGCPQYWKDDVEQLEQILRGDYEKKRERISLLADPEKVLKLYNIRRPGYQEETI
jgi:hypothetical protein